MGLYTLPTEEWTLQYNGLRLVYLELLTGAIGSPQGLAHYNMMSRVFNETSKNDFALAPKCHGACLQRHETCVFDVISTEIM